MKHGSAFYSGEELEVVFSAQGYIEDFGVPRSPTWTAWEDIKIEIILLLGCEVDPETLPDEVLSAIYELADDLEFTSG